MKRYRKPLIGVGIFAALLLLLFLLRYPILKGMGNYLIKESPDEKVEAIFVLSGGPLDRGSEAARLYQQGISQHIICTGANTPGDFKALGITYLESEITRIYLMHQQVPDSCIALIKEGTSTREEEQAIIAYCQYHNLQKVMVLSSKFHTRRISRTFKQPFEKAGITLLIHGAPSSSYDEQQWWAKEDGLINLNNEYIKLVYYWWKY